VDHKLQINFNVTLRHLPCRFASVDVSDAMGMHLLNVTRNVVKHRIDGAGQFLGKVADRAPQIVHGASEKGLAPAPHVHGLSVQLTDHNTFQQVAGGSELVLVNFYAPWCPWSQRLAPVWEETAEQLSKKPYASQVTLAKVDCTSPSARQICAEQRIHAYPTVRIHRGKKAVSHEEYHGDRSIPKLLAFIEKNVPDPESGIKPPPFWEQEEIQAGGSGPEGCIVQGFLHVNRVPGNFHISAHSATHSLQMSVVNMTHTVHHLSFGNRLGLDDFMLLPEEVALAWNPLHGMSFTARAENVTIEHYLKVVHTSFERTPDPRTHINTYQHTVNSHQYEDHAAYPALVFSYDLSPIEVVVKRERESFAAFLTQICAIVGGVFTVTGLVDSIVYHGDRLVRRKMEIGKAI